MFSQNQVPELLSQILPYKAHVRLGYEHFILVIGADQRDIGDLPAARFAVYAVDKFNRLFKGDEMVSRPVLDKDLAHVSGGIGRGIGLGNQCFGRFVNELPDVRGFRHVDGVLMRIADAVGSGLRFHRGEMHRSELAHRRFDKGIACTDRAHIFTREIAVRDVHGKHGAEIRAGTAADKSDVIKR